MLKIAICDDEILETANIERMIDDLSQRLLLMWRSLFSMMEVRW